MGSPDPHVCELWCLTLTGWPNHGQRSVWWRRSGLRNKRYLGPHFLKRSQHDQGRHLHGRSPLAVRPRLPSRHLPRRRRKVFPPNLNFSMELTRITVRGTSLQLRLPECKQGPILLRLTRPLLLHREQPGRAPGIRRGVRAAGSHFHQQQTWLGKWRRRRRRRRGQWWWEQRRRGR